MQYASFPGIGMKELLPKLSEVLATHRASALKISVPHYRAVVPQDNEKSIMQDWFWPRMAQWFKPKDVIVSETGENSSFLGWHAEAEGDARNFKLWAAGCASACSEHICEPDLVGKHWLGNW